VKLRVIVLWVAWLATLNWNAKSRVIDQPRVPGIAIGKNRPAPQLGSVWLPAIGIQPWGVLAFHPAEQCFTNANGAAQPASTKPCSPPQVFALSVGTEQRPAVWSEGSKTRPAVSDGFIRARRKVALDLVFEDLLLSGGRDASRVS
jgi:hypothetical protein